MYRRSLMRSPNCRAHVLACRTEIKDSTARYAHKNYWAAAKCDAPATIVWQSQKNVVRRVHAGQLKLVTRRTTRATRRCVSDIRPRVDIVNIGKNKAQEGICRYGQRSGLLAWTHSSLC